MGTVKSKFFIVHCGWVVVTDSLHTTQHEVWEAHQMKLAKFIRTESSPTIFWVPRLHNARTSGLVRTTHDKITGKFPSFTTFFFPLFVFYFVFSFHLCVVLVDRSLLWPGDAWAHHSWISPSKDPFRCMISVVVYPYIYSNSQIHTHFAKMFAATFFGWHQI